MTLCKHGISRRSLQQLALEELPSLLSLELSFHRHAEEGRISERLEVLVLSGMTGLGARALLAHAPRFEHLERVDLEDSALSEEEMAQLRAALPQVHPIGQARCAQPVLQTLTHETCQTGHPYDPHQQAMPHRCHSTPRQGSHDRVDERG